MKINIFAIKIYACRHAEFSSASHKTLPALGHFARNHRFRQKQSNKFRACTEFISEMTFLTASINFNITLQGYIFGITIKICTKDFRII